MSMDRKRGLNIGCGAQYHESTALSEWVNVDADTRIKADIHTMAQHMTAEIFGNFDEIKAIDVLEHVPDWKYALKNWVGMLQPGGLINIQVPSLTWIATRFSEGVIDFDTALRVIYGECTSMWDRHYRVFDSFELHDELVRLGMTAVSIAPLHVNLVAFARKS